MDLREVPVQGWERVVVAREGEYHAIIAVHSTSLGTAVGGTRLWRYGSEQDALDDALRLSRGMTYKNALAGLAAGGGKSVILAPERAGSREALFRAHGRAMNLLGGAYVTAEDVGTTPADMDIVARETEFVAGTTARSGDPSPRTARGVFRAIQAAALHRWGTDDLRDMRVAVQGAGNVGRHLAAILATAGAEVLVSDVDANRAASVAEAVGGRVVDPPDIYAADADVFAPCALGAGLNADTIPRLRVKVVAGGANNQLGGPEDGVRLAERDILYVPDYVANAGGVITGFTELTGGSVQSAEARVEAIYDTVLDVLRRAAGAGVLPHQAADRMAEDRIAAARPG